MSKIIHVRGTSGSGKSHLARRVMERYSSHGDLHRKGRKRPFATLHSRVGGPPLYVPGHYETDCGGADTIPTYDDYFDAVALAYGEGKDVLFEGLLSTPEINRTLRLHELAKDDLHIVFLDVPLEVCVESVNQRRRAKAQRAGKPEPDPLNPKNTESKHKQANSARNKLRAAGVNCHLLDREAAYLKVCELLEIAP